MWISYKSLYNEEKTKREELESKDSVLEHIKQDRKHNKLSTEASKTKKRYKHTLEENEALKTQLNVVLDVIENDGYKEKKVNIQTSVREQTAVIVASDWHVEEDVHPETVNWLNEYNIDEAKRRAQNFFHNATKRIEEVNWGKTDKVVLALLGDFISGHIHEELMENNSLSPTEAILETKNIIRGGIDMLLDRSYDLVIPCNFWNHWRTTQQKKIATAHKNNFERMMYKLLEQDYKNNKWVTFEVADGYFNYVDIYDKKVRFHHWDWMNYGGGIGWPTIPINKAIDRYNKGRFADLDVFGHFHQTFTDKRFVTNGSLIWTTPYSLKFGAEAPAQTLFMMDSKHWKTTHEPIYVMDKD